MEDTVVHLYEQSRRQLRTVAARYVGDDAEDVVQDAFLRALRSRHAFRGEAHPLTWISRIVVNASLDRCRRRTRWEHAYPRLAHGPTQTDAAFDDALAMRTALRQLTRDQRQVFVLYDVLGYTHREIAQRLAIPAGTSKSRLSDARGRLRNALQGRRRVSRYRAS